MDPTILSSDLREAVKTLVSHIVHHRNSRIVLEKIHEIGRKQRLNVARIIIQLVSSFDKLEDLIRVCVDNALDISIDPGMVFRGESVHVKILSELCKTMCGALIQAVVKDEIWHLISRKRSERQIRRHSQNIFDNIVNELGHFPVAFTRLCWLVDTRVFTRHPDMSRLGISNLVFLRFICPTLIEVSSSLPVTKYPKNMTEMVKNIQTLANEATRMEVKDTSKFTLRNLEKMRHLLDRLGTGTINDVPVRHIGYFIFDTSVWIQIVLEIGPGVFKLDDWIFVYNTFYKMMELEKSYPNTYNRTIDYYQFMKSKDIIRSRDRDETVEEFLSYSPETRKRILTRGVSEPIHAVPTLLMVSRSGTPGCSSDR